MKKYKRLIRTTLGEYLANSNNCDAGIYIIACYPALGCLYVGISDDVHSRIRQHIGSNEPLAQFLRQNMADACGFRLDILVSPHGYGREWLIEAERKLVQALHPVFNEQHLGE